MSGHDGTQSVVGWGRTAPSTATVRRVDSVERVHRSVLDAGERGVLARGCGRSYGDAAQNAGGLLLDMTGLNRLHSIDSDRGLVDVDAGATLDRLVPKLLRHGLGLPVLPGTGHVTVGGAVASDVHGKNHPCKGSFGGHVNSLDLVTADGRVRRLEPNGEASDLFWATVGGMGLTGVIVRAVLAATKIPSAFFRVEARRADCLKSVISLMSEKDGHFSHMVAWLDGTATGSRCGRGLVDRASVAAPDQLLEALGNDPFAFRPSRSIDLPSRVPGGLVNPVTCRVFNEALYRKAPSRRIHVQGLARFEHPLDRLGNWNRVYGRPGFCQYQLVVPINEVEAIRASLEAISRTRQVPALTVLKRFGAGNRSPLSFPMSGWTLAVDLPVRPGLHRLLRVLDTVTIAAGGRVYLAKDSWLSPSAMTAMYPRLDRFREIRRAVDPENIFRSDLARRLDL